VSLRGRLEIVEREPLVVLDAAHNAHSASAVANSVRNLFPGRRVTAVVSMLKRKDSEGFARELSTVVEDLLVTRTDSPRSMAPEILAGSFNELVKSIETIEDSDLAFETARRRATPDGLVLVTGSFYLVGQILTRYEEKR
jgi:dihydrofolate synthase/folylpolyglutamate synthase